MSDESGQKDPSMEEILGSIRKIISEDNAEGEPKPAAPGGEDEEDVLELTEEAPAGGGEERVEPVLTPAAEEPEPEKPRMEPVFGSRPVEETPPPQPGPEPEPQPEHMPEPPTIEASAEPEPPQPPEPAQAAPESQLVSEEATSATAASLSELNKAVAEQTGAKLGVSGAGNTVESMVKEMMRPMLREWLDENLPGIVERVVRREIQNLVDRSQDDD